MIGKNWKYLTTFYFVEGAPATNNPIENYYSTGLKTHRKKQLRTDRGINNQMSAMKRAGMLDRPQLLEIFLIVAVAISFVKKWTVFLCLFEERR